MLVSGPAVKLRLRAMHGSRGEAGAVRRFGGKEQRLCASAIDRADNCRLHGLDVLVSGQLRDDFVCSGIDEKDVTGLARMFFP